MCRFLAYFCAMVDISDRLRRLERLRGLLAGGVDATIDDLAASLDVSRRTLTRDLDVLRDDGVLLETDKGRGGGVRLARSHASGRVQLSTPEALSVLVSLAIAEKLQSPLLGSSSRAARQKIAAIFAHADRERVAALRRRILVGAPASIRVLSSYQLIRTDSTAVQDAFFEQRLLDIRYRDERSAESARTIEPQYIYLNPPAWYLLAWDHLRDGVRAFRFDRILGARLRSKVFRLRPAAPFLQAAESGVEIL